MPTANISPFSRQCDQPPGQCLVSLLRCPCRWTLFWQGRLTSVVPGLAPPALGLTGGIGGTEVGLITWEEADTVTG